MGIWRSRVAMLAAATGALIASAAYAPASTRPAVQVRASSPQMADISAFDNIWGFDAKMSVFDAWDPEKPRDYNNFNPFERNDESAMCDTNGCFPGQSRGYQPPNRQTSRGPSCRKRRRRWKFSRRTRILISLASQATGSARGRTTWAHLPRLYEDLLILNVSAWL